MPIFDMPLEQLREYKGSSPCPEDFDAYWERALDEMNKLDPQVTLTPASFQGTNTECFDLYFTGVGGSRIYAKYLRPKKIDKPIPALVQFHGYSGDSGEWYEKMAYTNMGFAIAAMDCRGQGGKSEDIGVVKGTTFSGDIVRGLSDHEDKLLFRQIFLDTALLTKIVMSFEEVDETRIGAFGGSQGGALTVACASLVPEIKKVAPMYPFLSDYKRVWDIDMCKDAYAELRDYFRHFDPRHEKEDEIFEKLGYIDIQNLASRIKGEVLWATGLQDTICPPSSQFAAYNKITSPKKVVFYPDFGHESLPGFMDMTIQFMADLL